MERWAINLGEIETFGTEGAGSYGLGVSRFLRGQGHTVIEVNRPDRSTRSRLGKSDPTDAEMAARSVLAGVAQDELALFTLTKQAPNTSMKLRSCWMGS